MQKSTKDIPDIIYLLPKELLLIVLWCKVMDEVREWCHILDSWGRGLGRENWFILMLPLRKTWQRTQRDCISKLFPNNQVLQFWAHYWKSYETFELIKRRWKLDTFTEKSFYNFFPKDFPRPGKILIEWLDKVNFFFTRKFEANVFGRIKANKNIWYIFLKFIF